MSQDLLLFISYIIPYPSDKKALKVFPFCLYIFAKARIKISLKSKD